MHKLLNSSHVTIVGRFMAIERPMQPEWNSSRDPASLRVSSGFLCTRYLLPVATPSYISQILIVSICSSVSLPYLQPKLHDQMRRKGAIIRAKQNYFSILCLPMLSLIIPLDQPRVMPDTIVCIVNKD
jgi:hypothetical protein